MCRRIRWKRLLRGGGGWRLWSDCIVKRGLGVEGDENAFGELLSFCGRKKGLDKCRRVLVGRMWRVWEGLEEGEDQMRGLWCCCWRDLEGKRQSWIG